ncbi:MAG: hypothetical protein MUD14_13410 [Hydrococcus sp. Prado102]|jgi:hypothetical protein|nr:hypothetical protein [Hydrococcus sp. Prado102]
MDYQIIHTTIGRFRIGVPHLANNAHYAKRLEWLVASLDFVTHVRINVQTGSLIVHYEASEVLSGTLLENIFTAIRQASIAEIPHSYLLLER